MDTSTNLLPSTGQPAARYPVTLPPAAGQNPSAFANLPNHMAFGPLAPQNPMAYAYAPPATHNLLPYAPPAQYQVPYSTAVANPTPATTTINSSKSTNLPTYPQMIAGAITDLKAKNGSSRQTITRYIGNRYPDLLPENYSAMVGKYLKQMKEDGSLDMVKHSYMLRDPRSVAPPPSPDLNLSAGPPKRGRGRPPKPKPKPIAVVQPEREPVLSLRLAESPVMCNSPQEVVDGNASTLVKRRPGRPRKVKDATVGSDEASGSILGKRSRGRPPAQPKPLPAPTAEPVVKRKRGRPARTEPPSVFKPRPRGRPRKNASSGGVKPVGRRGRPPKNVVLLDGAGGVLPAKRAVGSKAKEPRERKRLGRPPKKNASVVAIEAADQQQLVAYEVLKAKLEHIQSSIKHTVDVVKPYLHRETAQSALGALQQLEDLATADLSAPLNVQAQEPEPQQLTQPMLGL